MQTDHTSPWLAQADGLEPQQIDLSAMDDERTIAICGICNRAGVPERAAEYCTSGLSPAEVFLHIADLATAGLLTLPKTPAPVAPAQPIVAALTSPTSTMPQSSTGFGWRRRPAKN